MTFLPRQRIVAPVDFSEFSLEAVDVAVDIGGSIGAVHIVHVLPELEPTEAGMVWSSADDEVRMRKAREALNEKFSHSRYKGIEVEVLIGDAGHEITEYASRIAADLIVISSHGRTGIKRFLIGSVAERVVRLAHCPVLVLRK